MRSVPPYQLFTPLLSFRDAMCRKRFFLLVRARRASHIYIYALFLVVLSFAVDEWRGVNVLVCWRFVAWFLGKCRCSLYDSAIFRAVRFELIARYCEMFVAPKR